MNNSGYLELVEEAGQEMKYEFVAGERNLNLGFSLEKDLPQGHPDTHTRHDVEVVFVQREVTICVDRLAIGQIPATDTWHDLVGGVLVRNIVSKGAYKGVVRKGLVGCLDVNIIEHLSAQLEPKHAAGPSSTVRCR